ncbi:MAG: T9SS type A sorting domain-containing protein [Bacteroidia bacterium]|nr:T9SS type A sorting domain-containing protein [Bacteroidia bacterium]
MLYRNLWEHSPQFFTVKDLAYNRIKNTIIIGGDYRKDSISTESYGYLLEVGMDGLEESNNAIIAPTSSTQDGFNMGGIAIDPLGRPYIAGSYATDMNNPSSYTEKTISGLESDGKLRWSQMEGSRHFADVVFDEDDNSLIAVGSPDGPWTRSQPISILKMDADGVIKRYETVYDPAFNKVVKVIDLPNSKGYIITAIYDTIGLKAPYVLYFDQDLKRQWSFIYTNFLTEYEVSDATYHPDGEIAIAGTSYDPISEERRAFILNLTEEGKINYSHHFKVQSEGDAEGFGLTYVKHSRDQAYNGFIIGGSYKPSLGTSNRHALIFHINLDGKQEWAYDLSAFGKQDFTEDETVQELMFLEDRNMFVASGEYKASVGGAGLSKHIWVAKASIKDGKLFDTGSCSREAILDVRSDSLGIYKAGTDSTGGGLMNYAYNVTSLYYSRQSCSYIPVEDDQRRIGTNVSPELTPAARADRLEVMDLTGRLIYKADINNQNWKEGLPKGVYLIKYLKDRDLIQTEKIVLP